MVAQYTVADVAKHAAEGDAWIIIDGDVYDISVWAETHPGGKAMILSAAGTDASEQFEMFHSPNIKKKAKQFYIGSVGATSSAAPVAVAAVAAPVVIAAPVVKAAVAVKASKAVVHSTGAANTHVALSTQNNITPYGDGTPYGDPSWYQGHTSAYYNSTHVAFRAAVREFIDNEITPNCHAWDEAKKMPKQIWTAAAAAGILPAFANSKWNVEHSGSFIAGGVKPEEFDAFHELIAIDETCRCGSGGVVWGLFEGLQIGLPPVIHFGSTLPQQQQIIRSCMSGEKVICLAITEPSAGSDVAGLSCSAVLTDDGKHFIVNGEKKWITNGIYADYFTTAVRTGGPGMTGISLLLIERSAGVTTKQMQCQGMWASGTTYVTFEDVKVPVGNIIGKVNDGFKAIMYNFNHERWAIAAQAIRFSRVLLEESMAYAFKRKTFGKRLIDHPVIRLKLAHMSRQVEASHNYLENVTFQFTTLNKQEQNTLLAGPIALLKAQASVTMEYCAREAAQIFGGLSYTRGGQGEKVERLYREVRAYAIPAGSEEIMLDLAVKQAMKGAKL